MTIQQLYYAAEIARNDSINRAARNLFITQPTLSNSIKELEEEIGITIFERSRKGVELTADGIEFLRLSQDVLEQMDLIKQRYSTNSQGISARFQVSSQHYAFVVEAFIKFLPQSPSAKYCYSLRETKTLSAIEDVYTRKSCIGVIFMTTTNERLISQVLHARSIEFYELTSVAPHVFISKAHPLANKKSISLPELAPYPMIVYAQEGGYQLAEEIVMAENPQKIIQTHDRGTTNNIIANTLSYNIGTGYLIPKIIPDEITAIPLEDIDDKMRIGWIHLSGSAPTDDELRFIEMLKHSLESNFPAKL